MVWLILAMVVLLALAVAVIGFVAVPARRQGRQVLTPRGEDVVSTVSRNTDRVVSTAKERTGTVVGNARNRAQGERHEPSKASAGRQVG